MKARSNYLAILKIFRGQRRNARYRIKKRAFSKINDQKRNYVLRSTEY